MRQAPPADLTSCTLAGPSAEVASKAASGTRTITASQTGASCPAETALTPTTRLPRTARPMAATSTAAAIAAGTAARSRRRVRLFSREATWRIEPARRPETVSSGAPSRTASTSADSSVACLWRACSAILAERMVANGPTSPDSMRHASRMRPAGQ